MNEFPKQTMKSYLPYLISVPFLTVIHAGELVLEPKPFAVTHVLPANVLTGDVVALRLDAKAWTAFKIVSIANHGEAVKKGEALVVFDAEDIDKKIGEMRRALAAATLGLEQGKQELGVLEKTMPDQLAQAEREAKIAAEEFDYFTKTRRAAEEEGAKYSLKYKEETLASAKEELKQLLKMYEADDLTEQTEEIILEQQRAKVGYAEFGLRMEKLEHTRTMEVALPREAVSLELQRDATALAFENAKKDLPRSLKQKQLAVEEQEIALGQMKKGLEDLENDRALFEIKAGSDGIFYHGAVADGKWSGGDYVPNLVANGAAPTGRVFASFLPNGKAPMIHAFVKQQDALSLSEKSSGEAVVVGREDVAIPVKVLSVAKSPALDGTYEVRMEGVWPKELSAVTGQDLVVRMISYSKKDALLVPTKALEFGQDGWSLDVKLTDGKTERRVVKLGKSSGEMTEILKGLEAGQVVIVP